MAKPPVFKVPDRVPSRFFAEHNLVRYSAQLRGYAVRGVHRNKTKNLQSEYYQSLRTRGKHHLTAIGAVSRKLCNTIYTILKEDRPWQPIPPKGK